MWCVLGHQLSISSVNTRNAFATSTRTRRLLRTGSNSCKSVTNVASSTNTCLSGMSLLLYLRLKCFQSLAPEVIEIRSQQRKTVRIQTVIPSCARRLITHQPGLLQHPQVLRH